VGLPTVSDYAGELKRSLNHRIGLASLPLVRDVVDLFVQSLTTRRIVYLQKTETMSKPANPIVLEEREPPKAPASFENPETNSKLL
jgi:hypothetical protein